MMTLVITAARHTGNDECCGKTFLCVLCVYCVPFNQARYEVVLRQELGEIDYVMPLIYSDM